MINNDNKPLFTLTAEEVKELKDLLDYLNVCCRNEIVRNVKECQDDYFLVKLYASISNRADNLLNRIKQYQDEHNK